MDNDLETTEEAFDLIPEEVQQYIYSDGFDTELDALMSQCNITDAEKRKLFKGALFSFLAQLDGEDELLLAINDLTDNETSRTTIKTWVQTTMTQKIMALITEAYIAEDTEEDEQAAPQDAPVMNAAGLATLAYRLKQASIATPTKREYTSTSQNTPAPMTENTTPSTSSEAPISKPAIDPYHEAIDNE